MLFSGFDFLFLIEKRALIAGKGYGRNVIKGLISIIKLLQKPQNVLRHNPKHCLYSFFDNLDYNRLTSVPESNDSATLDLQDMEINRRKGVLVNLFGPKTYLRLRMACLEG
jgi:hypothetical protein